MRYISSTNAAELLEKDSNAVLVDVRNPNEVAEISVPGALLIPLGELALRVHELGKKNTLLFICRAGGRSSVAADIAEAAGFFDTYSIAGGITSWEAEGLPVLRGESRGFVSKNIAIAIGVVLTGVFFAFLIFSGDSVAGSTQASSFSHVTAVQFAEDIQKPGVVLIDVRTPEEYATGHIAGAININFYDPTFQEKLNKLDKTATYDIYCHSGNRSGKTLPLMQSLGFTHVQDLSGGITAWTSGGKPTVL